MANEINIGSNVYSSDGDKLGDVDQLVIDTNTNTVEFLIIDAGLFGDGRIVPLSAVATSTASEVRLSLTKDEVEQLPRFVEKELVQFRDASTYLGSGASMPMATNSSWMVVGAGGGGMAGTGSMGLVPTPISGEIVTRTVSSLSDEDVRISEGTEVVGSDYEKIGRVDHVLFDEGKEITGFIVKVGRVFQHDLEVPIAWVEGIASGHIRLNIPASEALERVRDR